ncbi:MAG: hypothetical protein JNL01_01795 [Bdellovibrionales bacterium]|nr:hypothetical protein [Bdellovibrionales bacterium]
MILGLVLSIVGFSSAYGQLPTFSNLTGPVSKELMMTVGGGLQHRPFDGATALGTKPGLELGITANLAKYSTGLGPALEDAGSSAPEIGVLPTLKLHAAKGIGEKTNIGVSAILYQGLYIVGGHIQWTLYNPEEGVNWAFRICYSYASVMYAQVHTWSPQLVIGRKLEYADPYIGISFINAHGLLEPDPSMTGGIPFRSTDFNYTGEAFIGLKLGHPTIGLQLVLEGSYNLAGMHTLGTKIGFGFQ